MRLSSSGELGLSGCTDSSSDPERMPIHERGRGVLRHWAGEVALAAETAATPF